MEMERSVRLVLMGNLLLIVCSLFYLLWWILAFKPVGAVKGMKSGWLLLPALIFGVAGVFWIVQGIQGAQMQQSLLSLGKIMLFAAVAYLLLAAGTWALLKRPVTTELLLIVAWTALTLAEIHMLWGTGIFQPSAAQAFAAVTLVFGLVSMIAYIRYYHLDAVTGYIDGMIPLILAAVMMAALDLCSVVRV